MYYVGCIIWDIMEAECYWCGDYYGERIMDIMMIWFIILMLDCWSEMYYCEIFGGIYFKDKCLNIIGICYCDIMRGWFYFASDCGARIVDVFWWFIMYGQFNEVYYWDVILILFVYHTDTLLGGLCWTMRYIWCVMDCIRPCCVMMGIFMVYWW